MNSLIPPANPSESYRAQLAALIQLGMPMVEKVPDKVPATVGLRCDLGIVYMALLKLQGTLMREEIVGASS